MLQSITLVLGLPSPLRLLQQLQGTAPGLLLFLFQCYHVHYASPAPPPTTQPPTTADLMLFTAIADMSIVTLNLSLMLNTVSFYQVTRRGTHITATPQATAQGCR